MRVAHDGECRWIRLGDDRRLGLVFIDEAEPMEGHAEKPRSAARSKLREDVMDALRAGHTRQSKVAVATGRHPSDGSVRRMLTALVKKGEVDRLETGDFELPVARPPKGLATGNPPPAPDSAGRGW
jgi:hypothetical protein